MKCPKCNQEMDPGWVRCPYDGTELRKQNGGGDNKILWIIGIGVLCTMIFFSFQSNAIYSFFQPTSTPTPTQTYTPTPTYTPSPTKTQTPTRTPTKTPTRLPTRTPKPRPTATKNLPRDVKIHIISSIGATMTLSISGPVEETYTIEPYGSKWINIPSGFYAYTMTGIGYKPLLGVGTYEAGEWEWTWEPVP